MQKAQRPAWVLLFAVLVLIGTLPLVWLRPFGLAPYHFAAVFLIVSLLVYSETFSATLWVFKRGGAIWYPAMVLVVLEVLFLARPLPPFELSMIVKHASYIIIAFLMAVAGVVLNLRKSFGYLYLGPLIAVLSFWTFMAVALQAAGIDPVEQFRRAATAGDVNVVVYPLLKAAFNATGETSEELRANLRHGIGLSFLPVMILGLLAYRGLHRKTFLSRAVLVAGVAVSLLIIVFTFSRSAWLALVLSLLVLSLPFMANAGKLVLGVIAGVWGIAAAVIAGSSIPGMTLILDRLGQTDSYFARAIAAQSRWEAISEYPLLGHPHIARFKEAHNLLLDYGGAFGFLGLFTATLLICGVVFLIGRMSLQAIDGKLERRFQCAAAAALLCPTLTRMFTAPNGFPEFGVWFSTGVAMAIITMTPRENAAFNPRRHVARPTS